MAKLIKSNEFVSKQTQISINMKNRIVENSIKSIKAIEKEMAPIEKQYKNSKKALEELIKEFEPLKEQYERLEIALMEEQAIVDLYTKGHSKSELGKLPAPPPVKKKQKGEKAASISWIPKIVEIIKIQGVSLSYDEIFESLSQDKHLAHTLMGMGKDMKYYKHSVKQGLDGHVAKTIGKRLIVKDGPFYNVPE